MNGDLQTTGITTIAENQELVDSIVAAVDIEREAEIGRLRLALRPFGLLPRFDPELRLSGHADYRNRIQELEDEADDLERELYSAGRRADLAEKDNAKLRKEIADLKNRIAEHDQGKATAK